MGETIPANDPVTAADLPVLGLLKRWATLHMTPTLWGHLGAIARSKHLVFKSGFLPKILGILLMIGCFGYLFDSVTFFLFPNTDMTIAQFTFIGELLLPLCLLIKGVNVEQWEKRALAVG